MSAFFGKTPLAEWSPTEYISAARRGRGGNHMVTGSQNAVVSGDDLIRAFKGVTVQPGKAGSRIFFNADQSYAGLGTVGASGTGAVFSVKNLLTAIGAGQVRFNGSDITGFVASSTLSYVKKSGGTYAAPVYQAGRAQPAAPTIYAKAVPSAGKIAMSGAIVVGIWRSSTIDGQPSLVSLPSNELTLTSQSVIVQLPLPDTNGQDTWEFGVPKIGFVDLGVLYKLPTSLGGQVSEATISYTRSLGSASVPNASNVVTAAGGAFTSADVGRRIAFGAFDSWITQVNSATEVVANDSNSSGGTITATGTVTHAVEGITRAVEISWTNGALLNQDIAPTKAFPPPAGQFAGVMNDVVFLDADGIIYVGEPGYIGSFPPSSAIFATEPAVHYLRISDSAFGRFGKHSFGVLYYVGGTPALEYQVVWNNLGILYPQNVGIGANGRVLMWLGKPVVFKGGVEPDYEYANKVMPDFTGWEAQTASNPVVIGYDPLGLYEVWCWQKKVVMKFVPKGSWCAPVDLTGKIAGNIMAAVTFDNKLFLSCVDGADLKVYQYDLGTGSTMVIQTDDTPPSYGDTITEVFVQGRVDNLLNNVKVEIIKNFDTAITLSDALPTQTGTRDMRLRKNVLGCQRHALRITMTSAGGDAGVDLLATLGARNEVLVA